MNTLIKDATKDDVARAVDTMLVGLNCPLTSANFRKNCAFTDPHGIFGWTERRTRGSLWCATVAWFPFGPHTVTGVNVRVRLDADSSAYPDCSVQRVFWRLFSVDAFDETLWMFIDARNRDPFDYAVYLAMMDHYLEHNETIVQWESFVQTMREIQTWYTSPTVTM